MDPNAKKFDFQPAWRLKNLPWILLCVDLAIVLVLWTNQGDPGLALAVGAILSLASFAAYYGLKKICGTKAP